MKLISIRPKDLKHHLFFNGTKIILDLIKNPPHFHFSFSDARTFLHSFFSLSFSLLFLSFPVSSRREAAPLLHFLSTLLSNGECNNGGRKSTSASSIGLFSLSFSSSLSLLLSPFLFPPIAS